MTSELKTGTRYTLSTNGFEQLPLGKIKRDGGTQSRAKTSAEHVERLVEALEAGVELPAIVVFYDGEKYWLADGFHRFEAHQRKMLPTISAMVRQGSRRDAVLHSAGANRDHGLPRTRDDVRRAIETLLRDEEWGRWSDREIARQIGCSPTTVGNVRSTVQIGQSATRISGDGRERPATQPARPTADVSREAELIGRASRVGYSVKPMNGRYQLQLIASKAPMGQEPNLDALEHRISTIERKLGERTRILASLPELPRGWAWETSDSLQSGVVQVKRTVNNLRSVNFTLERFDVAVDWAKHEARNPISWGHWPALSLDEKIARCEASNDPMAHAALVQLRKESAPAVLDDEDDEPYYDEDEDEDAEWNDEDDDATVFGAMVNAAPAAPVAPAVPKADPAQRAQRLSHIKEQFASLLERLDEPELRALYVVIVGTPAALLLDEDPSEAIWNQVKNVLNSATDAALAWAVQQ